MRHAKGSARKLIGRPGDSRGSSFPAPKPAITGIGPQEAWPFQAAAVSGSDLAGSPPKLHASPATAPNVRQLGPTAGFLFGRDGTETRGGSSVTRQRHGSVVARECRSTVSLACLDQAAKAQARSESSNNSSWRTPTPSRNSSSLLAAPSNSGANSTYETGDITNGTPSHPVTQDLLFRTATSASRALVLHC